MMGLAQRATSFAAPPARQLRPVVSGRRRALRTPRLRIAGPSRQAAREVQLDLQRLVDRAALEQFLYLRSVRGAWLAAARQAFARGQNFLLSPFTGGQNARHLERVARLLAAGRLAGRAQVRADANKAAEEESQQRQFAQVVGGQLPLARLLDFLRSLPVVERSRFLEASRAARQTAFAVKGVEDRAVAEALRDLLADSIEKGEGEREFLRRAEQLLSGLETDARSLRTLWHQQVGSALNAGRQEALEDAEVSDFLAFGVFDSFNDEVVRENHLALDGAIGSRAFWEAHPELTPFLGFNCRCVLLWISRSQRARFLDQGAPYFDIEAEGIPADAGPDDGYQKAA